MPMPSWADTLAELVGLLRTGLSLRLKERVRAVKVIEKSQEWCRSITERVLEERGYRLESTSPEEPSVVGVGPRSFSYRPLVNVQLSPVDSQKTRVTVSFAWTWKSIAVPVFFWLPLGLLSANKSIKVWEEFHLHNTPLPSATAVVVIALALWSGYCLFWRCLVAVDIEQARLRKTEDVLWEALGSNGSQSHEISAAWSMSAKEYTVAARMFLFVAVAGVLLLSRVGPWKVWVVLPFLCWCATVVFYWMAAAAGSPHRHQWKRRFYYTCLHWLMAATLPTLLLLPSDALDQVPTWAAVAVRAMVAGFVLCFQASLVSRVWRHFRDLGGETLRNGYYSPPSVRYEEISESLPDHRSTWHPRRFKFWTWMSFLTFTALWCIAVWHLGSLFFSRVLYLQYQGTSCPLGIVPPIVVSDERMRVWVEIALVCAMAGPMILGFLVALMARVSLIRQSLRHRYLMSDPVALNLPDRPLQCLEERLRVRTLSVIQIPKPSIKVSVEPITICRRAYRLNLSVGAIVSLTRDEMEALLWHECHHAPLLKVMRWRYVVLILTPVTARFLDLAGDLYEEEREADLFAAARMGSVEPLISALGKLRQQSCEEAPRSPRDKKDFWHYTGMDYLRPLWDPAWAAYLHPDPNQRIRWLEEQASTKKTRQDA